MIKNQQLLHALALYEHRNFHRAAAATNISQPAFSRSIRRLEEELGVRLFDRHPQSVSPTIYGEAMLQRAEIIITGAEELQREMALLQGLEIGSFSIAMGPYGAEMCGSRALGRMLQDHPQLMYRVIQRDWREVSEKVLEQSVDLGFADFDTERDGDLLQSESVGRHDLVFFCRKGHPLTKKKTLTDADIEQYPMANVTFHSRVPEPFPGKFLYNKDLSYVNHGVHVEDLAFARSLVAESDALSIAAPVQLRHWLESGEITVLPYRTPGLTAAYSFIYLRDRLLSPAAVAFMQQARRVEEENAQRNRQLMECYFP